MISKVLYTAVIVLFSSAAFAGLSIQIKGEVVRIEKNMAVIKNGNTETEIPMKNLSKKDATKVMEARGTKKLVHLSLSTHSLEGAKSTTVGGTPTSTQ